jgi:hypothetical protein
MREICSTSRENGISVRLLLLDPAHKGASSKKIKVNSADVSNEYAVCEFGGFKYPDTIPLSQGA